MRKILNKKFLGILISIAFIAVIFHEIDIERVIVSFRLINPVWLLFLIPVYFFSFIVRAFRWRVFLSNKSLKFSSLLSSIFIGFSLNCLLPARAGEIYRAYFFSKKENLDKTKVFTSVILERFFDGFILFLILLAVIYLVNSSELFCKIAFWAGAVFFSGLTVLLIMVKLQKSGGKREKVKAFLIKISGKSKKLINKVFSIINSIFDGLKSLDSYPLLSRAIFLTFLIWVLEGSTMFFVIKSFGIDISYFGAFLVLTVTAFSSLIPAGPASIGPYQWGYIIALNVFSVEKELALAVSVTNQFILIVLILFAGFYFIWKDHININEPEIKKQLNWS